MTESQSNTNMPAVSVILPAYNSATFLPAALDSIFAQTFTDYEVIVVDDGSTDDIVSAVAPYIGRIRFIQQKNSGVSAARNTALRAARGEFIAWLDADDVWLERKLEIQLALFADPKVGMVYSDFETHYDDGQIRPSFLTNHPFAASGYVFDRYAQSRFFLPSTTVTRRACIDQAGLFDEDLRISQDVELFGRICLHWNVASVAEVLTIRNEAAHNLTANKKGAALDTIWALKKILAREKDVPPSGRQAAHEEIARQYWWVGYEDFQQKRMKDARANLLSAVRYDRSHGVLCLRLIAASFLPESLLARLKSLFKHSS